MLVRHKNKKIKNDFSHLFNSYNSSSTVTLRLNKNEEVLKSNSCSNVKSREISPLSVLNADDALDRLTKSFSEMPVPSSSPPVPARLDLNQDASMMMQGDQVTDVSISGYQPCRLPLSLYENSSKIFTDKIKRERRLIFRSPVISLRLRQDFSDLPREH